MLHLLYHQGPRKPPACIRTQIIYASGQDTTHTKTPPGTDNSGVVKRADWKVEWRSVVFSDESRFCLYASDGRIHVRLRLSDCNFRSTFAHDTGPTSGFLVWGPSVKTRGHIWYFCRVKQTVPATLHRLLTPCYYHFFDRKVMCFLSITTTVHIGHLRRNMLFVVYNNCHDQQDPQISRQLNTYGTWWSGNLTLSPEPATIIAELRQRMQDTWDNLLQDYIRHLYDRLHARIHVWVAAKGGDTVHWYDCLCVSFGLNLWILI